MVAAIVTREPWHRRAGARLPGGPGAGAVRADGRREATRHRAIADIECFRCAAPGWVGERDKNRRKLIAIRVVAGGSTLGTTLLCGECVGVLKPLDPDPLTVEASP